jgi:hypothetical protein
MSLNISLRGLCDQEGIQDKVPNGAGAKFEVKFIGTELVPRSKSLLHNHSFYFFFFATAEDVQEERDGRSTVFVQDVLATTNALSDGIICPFLSPTRALSGTALLACVCSLMLFPEKMLLPALPCCFLKITPNFPGCRIQAPLNHIGLFCLREYYPPCSDSSHICFKFYQRIEFRLYGSSIFLCMLHVPLALPV